MQFLKEEQITLFCIKSWLIEIITLLSIILLNLHNFPKILVTYNRLCLNFRSKVVQVVKLWKFFSMILEGLLKTKSRWTKSLFQAILLEVRWRILQNRCKNMEENPSGVKDCLFIKLQSNIVKEYYKKTFQSTHYMF